jgi:hypothetical protein
MEIDTKIARVKELIAKREEIDAELSELLAGASRERRSPKCSICGVPRPPGQHLLVEANRSSGAMNSGPLRRAFPFRIANHPSVTSDRSWSAE